VYNYAAFCGWKYSSSFKLVLVADPQIEGLSRANKEGFLGNLSNYYNDYYQRHVVSSLVYFLRPTHMAVLGDIFSFQRLSDTEFNWRVARFKWIFESAFGAGIALINLTGNHDIGYGNEASQTLVRRWERVFGKVNFNLTLFNHNFVILNSMNLDSSRDQRLHVEVWDQVRKSSTWDNIILLTHIPLHKDPSPCVDKYFIEFDNMGFVVQQNFLSERTTKKLLQDLHPKFIFTGHDHHGCEYVHPDGAKEITARSIMGDFSGSAVLFEIEEYEDENKTKQFKYNLGQCNFVPIQLMTVIAVAFFLGIICWTLATILSL